MVTESALLNIDGDQERDCERLPSPGDSRHMMVPVNCGVFYRTICIECCHMPSYNTFHHAACLPQKDDLKESRCMHCVVPDAI